MRAKHLCQWLIASTRYGSPDATNWLKDVAIVQAAFQYGTLVEECTWQTVVLILKGKRSFWVIGIIEVLWKAIASLLNCRLTAAISFYDTLRGFQARWGTGTAALEANLLQKLTPMREAVLFEVLLDLRKVYDALDLERALDLLAAYEVGPRTVRLLQT